MTIEKQLFGALLKHVTQGARFHANHLTKSRRGDVHCFNAEYCRTLDAEVEKFSLPDNLKRELKERGRKALKL
jgi:hypothetical protein